MKQYVILGTIGLTIVGCGSSGSKPTDTKREAPDVKLSVQNQRSLFPLEVGNSWTYALEVVAQTANQPKQTRTAEVQYKVTKVSKESSDSTKATLGIFQDGKLQDEQEWSCDNKGIFQISMKAAKVPYIPKQPAIRFPLKDQDEFRWEGTGLTPIGKQGSMKTAFKNDGIQKNVDTDMGPMSALFMQNGGSFKTTDGIVGNQVVNSWFTPGVGLVRFRQVLQLKNGSSSIILRLKSYNVKK
jgi:hypothetical protein